mmetsp:Transcript_102289/g.125108  ORF Transcript_102289/g.125108 Transcript_102289/m.125108 type:complete len:216 (-) Transcript_102289:163-810(-)
MTFLVLLISFYNIIIDVNGLNANVTCGRNTICPDDGICDPNTGYCVDYNATDYCGIYGELLTCNGNGIVSGECGSGGNGDCTSSICPQPTWEAIQCNYPGLEPSNGYNYTKWLCGGDGVQLSCKDIGGSVLTGVCGAGKHEDCKQYCDGYHGIQCVVASQYTVDFSSCDWVTGDYGEWVYCEQNKVAAGHCGSAKRADCGHKKWHGIECCKLVYP